ncbi:MAG: cytochrome c-type biogenesis protein [Burkholderiales bacterium]
MLALILALCAGAAFASEAAPAAEDPALEKRVNALSAELRCLVCQNQTIADSNAGLAVDLKNQIREKLKQGQSESQIIDYMVARYGDFVLYRPPVKATTFLLWFGPLLLVLGGLIVLYRRLKGVSAQPQAELSEADRKRAARLLGAAEKEKS